MKKTIVIEEKNRKLSKNIQPIINIQYEDQRKILNQLYLEDDTIENKEHYLSELKKKWNGYKYQDKKNNIYHKTYFISFNDLLDKMVASQMQCFYCSSKCLFLYDKSYDNLQWTLDRINNNKGHTCENTVICCLKCNISRGNIDHTRFIESKKIRVVRKLD